jgi:hypothetical protein
MKQILRIEGVMPRRSYIVQSVKRPCFLTNRKEKQIPRVPQVPKVKCSHFERDPAIGMRDASKKPPCTISKVPFFTDRTNEYYTTCANSLKMICLQIETDQMNRMRDISKKLLCTISEVPFFIDRSERNLYHMCHMLRK